MVSVREIVGLMFFVIVFAIVLRIGVKESEGEEALADEPRSE